MVLIDMQKTESKRPMHDDKSKHSIEMWGCYNFNNLLCVKRTRKVCVKQAEESTGEKWKICKAYIQIRKVTVITYF